GHHGPIITDRPPGPHHRPMAPVDIPKPLIEPPSLHVGQPHAQGKPLITQPDLTVQLDRDLMESAELTGERPQTVTYRIQPAATWSDGVSIGAEDFTYLWRRSNGAD